MTTPAAHSKGWQISEVVFGVPLLAAIAVDFFRPLPIAAGWYSWVLIALGAILLAVGGRYVYLARRELAKYSQPAGPGKPTTVIVTTGIYSSSRNPLYLGVTIIMLGVGLVLNNWWILIFLVVAVVLCHIILIFPEERYLDKELGEQYRSYRRSVNRWIGRKRV